MQEECSVEVQLHDLQPFSLSLYVSNAVFNAVGTKSMAVITV